MSSWEHIFKKDGKVFEEVNEGLIKAVDLFKKDKVSRVLDLGFGSGRHTVFLASQGFEVYGTDLSETGLEMTNKWLSKENLTASLSLASCYERFPFENDFFDAVVSTRVIYHNYHDKVLYCISEIERVLRQKGLLYALVPDQRYKDRDLILKKVEDHTFIPQNGDEVGVPHVIYDEKLLYSDFKNFEILDLKYSETDHYAFLAKRK
jgi:SAM-dependent methyltransferase